MVLNWGTFVYGGLAAVAFVYSFYIVISIEKKKKNPKSNGFLNYFHHKNQFL